MHPWVIGRASSLAAVVASAAAFALGYLTRALCEVPNSEPESGLEADSAPAAVEREQLQKRIRALEDELALLLAEKDSSSASATERDTSEPVVFSSRRLVSIEPNAPIGPSSLAARHVVVGRKLGTGSFGAVYAGSFHGVECALKFISSEAADELMKECDLLDALCHPNVIKLFGVCTGRE